MILEAQPYLLPYIFVALNFTSLEDSQYTNLLDGCHEELKNVDPINNAIYTILALINIRSD